MSYVKVRKAVLLKLTILNDISKNEKKKKKKKKPR
jgi:hypothetical protein